MMQLLPGLDIPALLLLLGLAFFVEKHHTARWTVAANSVILITAFGIDSIFGTNIFSLYILGSIIAAILTVISYIKGISLNTGIHTVLHFLYSSKTVLGVVLAAMFNALSYAIIFILLIWFISIYYFGHPLPL